MKFDLIAKDLTADQARDVLDLLQPQQEVTSTRASAPVATPGFTPPAGAGFQPPFTPPASAPFDGTQEPNNGADPNELDARGFPHNDKIHSESAAKTEKGVWKKRRGVADEVVAQVEQEMRAAGFGQVAGATQTFTPPAAQPPFQAPQAQPGFTPPPVNPGFAPPAAAPGFAPPVGQPAFTPPVAQPPVAAPVAAAPVQDFNGLMGRVAQLFSQGQASPDYVKSITDRTGQYFNVQINAITDISANPQMVAYAWYLLQTDGKA